jgi:hypothetical protein
MLDSRVDMMSTVDSMTTPLNCRLAM